VQQVILIIESPSYCQGYFGACGEWEVAGTDMGVQEAGPLNGEQV